MCTPLLEHAERLRSGFRRGREAGARFRVAAWLVLQRMAGVAWHPEVRAKAFWLLFGAALVLGQRWATHRDPEPQPIRIQREVYLTGPTIDYRGAVAPVATSWPGVLGAGR